MNGALAFSITAGNIDGTFNIQSDGKLYTKKTVDREKIQSFNLTVLAFIFILFFDLQSFAKYVKQFYHFYLILSFNFPVFFFIFFFLYKKNAQ